MTPKASTGWRAVIVALTLQTSCIEFPDPAPPADGQTTDAAASATQAADGGGDPGFNCERPLSCSP